MGRFAKKYTDQQKLALFAYAIDGGHTAPETVKAAAAGELRHENQPVGAFQMPLMTARDYIRDERKRRDGTRLSPLADLEPNEAARKLYKRCVTLADRQLRYVEQKSRPNKPPDPDESKAAIDLVARVVSLGKGLAPQGPTTGPASPKQAKTFAHQLEQDHKRRLRGVGPPAERTTGNGHPDHPQAA